MKKLFTILLVFLSISVSAQYQKKLVTNNISNMIYHSPDSLVIQEQIYDTTTTFIINMHKYSFQMNGVYYVISEYAYNEPYDVYILLIEWSKNKFVNVLYYPNKELILIKYLYPNIISWYYK
jgi:hypothetical protein